MSPNVIIWTNKILLVWKTEWNESFAKPPDHFGALRGKSIAVFIRVKVTAVRPSPTTFPAGYS